MKGYLISIAGTGRLSGNERVDRYKPRRRDMRQASQLARSAPVIQPSANAMHVFSLRNLRARKRRWAKPQIAIDGTFSKCKIISELKLAF
jgi:hypothetical protein